MEENDLYKYYYLQANIEPDALKLQYVALLNPFLAMGVYDNFCGHQSPKRFEGG